MTAAFLTGIELCVFDAYGTLYDFNSAVARHRAAIGPKADALAAEAAVAATVERFGRLDGLVLNAGRGGLGSLLEAELGTCDDPADERAGPLACSALQTTKDSDEDGLEDALADPAAGVEDRVAMACPNAPLGSGVRRTHGGPTSGGAEPFSPRRK